MIEGDNPVAYWRGPFPSPGVVGSQLPDTINNTENYLNLWNGGSAAGYPKDAASILPSSSESPALDFIPDSNVWRNQPGESAFNPANAFSLSFWMKTRALTGNVYHDLVRKGDNLATFIEYVGGQYRLCGRIRKGGATIDALGSVIAPNTLYHVGLSFNRTSLRLYLDGEEDAVQTFADGPMETGPSNFVFGQYGGSSNGFDGLFAEVALFHTALTAGRFLAHYLRGVSG
jgi:hypothetical protein